VPTERQLFEHLTITDYSDREFLLICKDVAEGDGWFEAVAVAERVGVAKTRIASSRLAWLRRYGAVEREIERDEAGNIRATRGGKVRYTQRWKLSPLGEAIALGRLRKRDEQALSSMDEGQMLMAVRYISQQSRDATGAGKLMQREWRYGHGR
jgi:hypothetical protein